MKFVANFYRQYWQCGDGCCTESWVNMDVSKDGKYCGSEENLSIYDENEAMEAAMNFVDHQFDLVNEEYELEITGDWDY